MNRSLVEVTVRIDRSEVVDESGSHTPQEVISKYSSWIESLSYQVIRFKGATFAAQLEGKPNPKVRVALEYNPGVQPLISGASIGGCGPMASSWLPDQLEDTEISTLKQYKIAYQTHGEDKEELARTALKKDTRNNIPYQIEGITVEGDQTEVEVYVPDRYTDGESPIQRLFPTAIECQPVGEKHINTNVGIGE